MSKSKRAPATGKAKSSKVEIPAGLPSGEWTLPQLRASARRDDIDLTGLRLKAHILAALLAHHESAGPESLLAATDRSIAKAIADKILDADLHAGPITTLRILARKIDTEDEMREVALAWAEFHASDSKPAKPPPIDNVSIPTYRNYCESLGLTLAAKKESGAGQGGGKADATKKSKLGQLRSIHTGT